MYEAIWPNLSGRPFISPSVLSIASAVFFALSITLRRSSSVGTSSFLPEMARFIAAVAKGSARGARAVRRARRPSLDVGGRSSDIVRNIRHTLAREPRWIQGKYGGL